LTAVYPSAEGTCAGSSKDHDKYGEATSIVVYAIGIKYDQVDCQYLVGPDRFSFGPAGGTGNIIVTTDIGCPVPVSTGDYFIALEPKGQLTGNQSISLRVQPHGGATPRNGAVSVAGRSVPVLQEGAPVCTDPNLKIGRTQFAASGGAAVAEIIIQPGCAWIAQSDSDFISFSRSSRQGAASIDMVVAANRASVGRTATVTIGGAKRQVTQDGAPASSTVMLYPHIAVGGWITTLTIVNANSSDTPCQIRFNNDQGNEWTVPFRINNESPTTGASIDRNLRSGETLTVEVSGPAGMNLAVGSAIVASPAGGLTGFVSYREQGLDIETAAPLAAPATTLLIAVDETTASTGSPSRPSILSRRH
jgi:hypothetical protein